MLHSHIQIPKVILMLCSRERSNDIMLRHPHVGLHSSPPNYSSSSTTLARPVLPCTIYRRGATKEQAIKASGLSYIESKKFVES